MIIPVWQNIGCSSHMLSHGIGLQLKEKATHTGTLDPLANGVLVVLTGEDRLKKSHYSQWHKTYEFSVLCGIATDSFDQLGMIKELSSINMDLVSQKLKSALPNLIGKQNQDQPTASASRSGGKSGFDFLKSGETLVKTNQIEVFSFEYCSEEILTTAEILSIHTRNCNKVVGDFRQDFISTDWRNQLSTMNEKRLVIKLKAQTSKRTYIRSLVHDLSQSIGIPLTTWSITRTHNGPYGYSDCVQLLQ